MATGGAKPNVEAVQSRKARRPMPTRLKAAELEGLDVAVRERAVFSAKVIYEEFLERKSSSSGGSQMPGQTSSKCPSTPPR